MNLFNCFFLKKLNNFVGFITPVVEKWLIHMKSSVAAPALLVLHVSYDWPHDCSNWGVNKIIIWLTTEVYIVCIEVATFPSKTSPPALIFAKPSIKSANCPSRPFLGNFPQYIGFSWASPTPLKIGFFSQPSRY